MKRKYPLFIYTLMLLIMMSSKSFANNQSKYYFVKLKLDEVYHPFLPDIDKDTWKRALLAGLAIRYVATDSGAILKNDDFPVVFKDDSSIIFQFSSEEMSAQKPIYAVAFNYNLDNFEPFYSLPIFDMQKQRWYECNKKDISQNSIYSYNQANFVFPILEKCVITPIHFSGSVEVKDDIKAFVQDKAPYLFDQVTKDNLTIQDYDKLFHEALNIEFTPKRIKMDKNLKSWQNLIYLPDSFYHDVADEIAHLDKRNVILSYQSSKGSFQFRRLDGLSPPSKAHENLMVKLMNADIRPYRQKAPLNDAEQQLMNDFFAYQSGTFIKYDNQVIGYSIITNCNRQLKSIKLNINDATSWKTFDTKMNSSEPFDLKESDKRPTCLNINKNLDRYKSLKSEQLEKELMTLFNYIDEKRKESPIMPELEINI